MKCNKVRLVTISQRLIQDKHGEDRMLQKTSTIIVFCIALLTACGDTTPVVTSTLITNAVIHNGSGSEAFHGSVRIDGDRIVEIGDFEAIEGEALVDAGGLVLAPGFIDTHSHHDRSLSEYRHMPGVLSQGITTIVRGVDGFSKAEDEQRHLPLVEFNLSFADAPAAVNIASYSAHNSIRQEVMGDDNRRPATPDEVSLMAGLVKTDMENGAIGLATGLEYEPGIFSETSEVIALAKVAAEYGGRYMSHVRDEDDRQMDAFDEVIKIGREAGLPVHISHIKLADREFWGTTNAVLEKLSEARSNGIEVSADIYPYERWASNLAVLFPERDYSDRAVAEFTFAHTATPEDIVLSSYAPNPEFNGLSVAEVASILEKDVETTLLELALAADDYRRETGRGGAGIIAKGMDEGDVAGLMLWEHTNICSDGSHGGGHPRGYGAFPRVLGRYVRTLGVLPLSEAIHKMTALAAQSIGVSDRGRIRTGYFADLVLFDPETIGDRSTMQDPTALSVGIEKVWVNGALAFENGEPTMRFPGRIVSRGSQ
jgi:N-acyl-D-amino-acid deacylase